jgi:hypothetical protein
MRRKSPHFFKARKKQIYFLPSYLTVYILAAAAATVETTQPHLEEAMLSD